MLLTILKIERQYMKLLNGLT